PLRWSSIAAPMPPKPAPTMITSRSDTGSTYRDRSAYDLDRRAWPPRFELLAPDGPSIGPQLPVAHHVDPGGGSAPAPPGQLDATGDALGGREIAQRVDRRQVPVAAD